MTTTTTPIWRPSRRWPDMVRVLSPASRWATSSAPPAARWSSSTGERACRWAPSGCTAYPRSTSRDAPSSGTDGACGRDGSSRGRRAARRAAAPLPRRRGGRAPRPRPGVGARRGRDAAMVSRAVTRAYGYHWRCGPTSQLGRFVPHPALCGGDLGERRDAALDHEPLERGEPAVVVRRAGACPDLGDQALLELSPRDPKALDDAERHAERSSLPRRFEDELTVAA